MAKHEENWVGFPGGLEEEPALVTADLGWGDEGPDERRSMLVRVRVPTFDHDEETGLTSFLRTVEPFDAAIMTELSKKINAVPVGTFLTQSHRWWIFYASRGDGAEEIVAKAATKVKGVTAEVMIDDDPEWEFYGNVLFPDDAQQRYIGDHWVIAQLEQSGDEAEVARPIEHLAMFPDANARDRFVDWCEQNGFTVTAVSDEFNEEWEGFTVEFNHIGPALLDEVNEKTWMASEAADECGGLYDGWQTSIIKDGKPVTDD